MKSISFRRILFASVLSLMLCFEMVHPASAAASFDLIPFIVLSRYNVSLSVGEEFYLAAFSSNGKIPKFKSSNSKIASVNTYGRVTAKQTGTCRITAKVSSAEASCTVKVKKTQLSVNSRKISLEHGETFQLETNTSSKMAPVFSSNRKSIAVVDSNGLITACKPGDAVITIKADKAKITCQVKVKKPTISLSHLYLRLYRCQKQQLTASVSSGLAPVWKSNKSSIATVSDTGLVTAHKHGTALITAKVDGVSKICEVVVPSPQIKLQENNITISVGERKTLDYTVSSKNAPLVRSSKPNIVKVDQLGNLTALSPGTAVITFSEDGAKETCNVRVIS